MRALIGTFSSVVLTVLTVCASMPLRGDHSAFPGTVTIAGNLQEELSCPNDWLPDCALTQLNYDAEDAVWQRVFNLPAGSWNYVAALNDTWNEFYGADGANILLSLGASTNVKFYYSHQTHWITENVNEIIVTVAGSFQSELGCSGDWQPDCLRSWLQDPDGDGVYSFITTAIPAGNYEAIVAHNESWNEIYGAGGLPGGGNIPFSVPANAAVTFEYDPVNHNLGITATANESNYAILHYFRADGDYGDHTSGDFNDYWGLHLWGADIDPAEVTDWTRPKPFLGETEYGRFAWVKLAPGATEVNFIVHREDVRDGTNADRRFDPSVAQELWLKNDDGNQYAAQADAQGFVTIHYRRPAGDYGDFSSSDFDDFWGLHLWGNAIAPSEATSWTVPKKPDGFDSYGAFFKVQLQDSSQPVNFIVHRGDEKDTGQDRSFSPLETPTIWLQAEDVVVYDERGAAQDFAVIHYHRDDGDYGDPASSDYNDFWGLHVWSGAANPLPGWTDPIRPAGRDPFGIYFKVDLDPEATELAYIIHRGDNKDPGPDQLLNLRVDGYEVWQLNDANPVNPYIVPLPNATDTDADGYPDVVDNCTLVINTTQRDTDKDGHGNYCDPDFDNNGNVDFSDLAYLKSQFFAPDADADLDGNGTVDFADLAILKSMFFGSPGPSGLVP